MLLPKSSNSRRQFLRGSSLALLAAALPSLPVWGQARRPSAASPTTATALPTAAEALRQLQAGNLRFQKGQLVHPNETLKRRRDVALTQAPFATVLACADSRESPELIFDQGLDDLFVTRTAGRAPGNAYSRTSDNIFFYTELHNAPAGPALRVHYHLTTPDGSAADADASLSVRSGSPTIVVGQLPLGLGPDGPFTLFSEIYGGPDNKKLLTGHRTTGQRNASEYAPAGAAMPR